MRSRIDPFIVALLVAALLASFIPTSEDELEVLKTVSLVTIGVLFFLYGVRLSTPETLAGLRHWRLQVLVLTTTFVAFPLAGLAARLLETSFLTPALASGVLLLCLVPTSVLGNVVYTRIAGGNVAAAVVCASLSGILGVFLTPALVALLMTADATIDANSVVRIVLQLFVPFVVGQLLRPALHRWVEHHEPRVRFFERGSIVLVVFVAFSEGAEADIWSTLSIWSVLALVVVCAALFAIAVGWTWGVGLLLRFSRADRITVLFCGTNKSLASGLPIASVLFTGDTLALLVLPLMIYHQFQIIIGAFIANRLARTRPS